ncbi:YqiA/YcfP family alpha/beta fold hydrolase [Caldimonas taiwanensis]|uniref:YqiA/YcfP family alpha/beta fold hydrolase n=1 Tax=Caldimonas taiwanensis TaxID=307483 RepID=UPI0007823931|nr:YqiA/YcfP family alpha/beta fold hydrolase [Caldimonas taiwanensis]
MPRRDLLYLHGFRSSPRSTKAQHMGACVARRQAQGEDWSWHCPQLPPSPAQAWSLIESVLLRLPHDRRAVIGSSLGGFYATVAAERFGCPAVLINPAVDPARDLARYIGEITAWHSEERFWFRAEYIEELRALTPGAITRGERYFVLVAQGDEVLDWREMAARYAGTRLTVLKGGDHALSSFPDHIDDIFSFLEHA